MSKIPLNNVDLAWLRMESLPNPMIITVVLEFKGQINYDLLISILRGSLGRYRRFRQRIVIPGRMFSRPYWEDDPDYRVEKHVERVNLRFPADDAALEELVNLKMNTALDFSQPLWKITLVENHARGSMIICRVHHCIADGISLTQVLLRMTTTSTDLPADRIHSDNPINKTLQVPDGTFADEKMPQAEPRFDSNTVLSQSDPVAPPPTHSQAAVQRNPTFTEILSAAGRIIFRPPDPPTMLKGPLGIIKKAVWSEPLGLPEIKLIARNHQATVNDVFMAVVTGAIRRYMDFHNDYRKRNIRAFNLVNMRGRTFDEELGNKFGLVFLSLPLDRAQPLDRLAAIKKGMDKLKASAEYAASYMILNILGRLPGWIEHLAIRILDTKGTVVATNVPGPRHPVYLAGAMITSLKGWVPQSGRIGVGLSIISYNDQVFFGLNADAGLIPDPERFLGFFHDEFETLKAAP